MANTHYGWTGPAPTMHVPAHQWYGHAGYAAVHHPPPRSVWGAPAPQTAWAPPSARVTPHVQHRVAHAPGHAAPPMQGYGQVAAAGWSLATLAQAASAELQHIQAKPAGRRAIMGHHMPTAPAQPAVAHMKTTKPANSDFKLAAAARHTGVPLQDEDAASTGSCTGSHGSGATEPRDGAAVTSPRLKSAAPAPMLYFNPQRTALSAGRPDSTPTDPFNPVTRKATLDKFYRRRRARVWAKKVRYACRKSLANGRLRIKGRFVKSGSPEAKAYYAAQAAKKAQDAADAARQAAEVAALQAGVSL